MSENIQYFMSSTQDGFEAFCNGRKVGEITFVRIGVDMLLIDYTSVVPEFRSQKIGLTLLRKVAEMARMHKMHIIALCPFVRMMFGRYSEFDDVRLLNYH